MFGDYAENWASISLLKPGGAQWLSGLFSLTGRWKWELVFGHASLRENLDGDIKKGLKSEGNRSGPISHGWKRVISQRATHIRHGFHSRLSLFQETPSHTKLKQERRLLRPKTGWISRSPRDGSNALRFNNEAVMVGRSVFNILISYVYTCPKAPKRLLMRRKLWPWKGKIWNMRPEYVSCQNGNKVNFNLSSYSLKHANKPVCTDVMAAAFAVSYISWASGLISVFTDSGTRVWNDLWKTENY